MTPILEVTRLHVVRGSTTILRGGDVEVRPGGHLLSRGGDGSGKTALRKSLTGFRSPAAGEVTVVGER